MKKLFILLVIAAPLFSFAQMGGLANRIKSKVSQKVNDRIDQKADKAIDQALDKAEGKSPTAEAAPGSTPASAPAANTGSIKSYSKYDFIPGEQILYYDNFNGEALAELPTGWNTNSSGEVVTLEGFEGNWLRLHKGGLYLSSNTKTPGENFTLEFDLILQLKNNGWMFPEFSTGLFASSGETPSDNTFLKIPFKYAGVKTTLHPGANAESRVLQEAFVKLSNTFRSQAKEYAPMSQYYGKVMHVAMQVQKERLRFWLNEAKLFDIPKAIPAGEVMNQLFFQVGGTNYSEEQYAVYISNIKLAQGIPDTRHKLVDEGKFSTTAILFDVNAASIKAESAPVLKEIATVLQQYKDLKVRINGHTDSDGSDAANKTLSEKRAAAVKEALVSEYGIDATRLQSEGKGEAEPVGDNKTKEGKAANRRVEFIKL